MCCLTESQRIFELRRDSDRFAFSIPLVWVPAPNPPFSCSRKKCAIECKLRVVSLTFSQILPICEKSPVASCLGSSLPGRILSRLTPIRRPPDRHFVRSSHGGVRTAG